MTDPLAGRTWEISAHYIPGRTSAARLVMMDDITNVVAFEASSRRNERVASLDDEVKNFWAHDPLPTPTR